MRRKRSHEEGETRRYDDAQHDVQRGGGKCKQSFGSEFTTLCC